MKRLILILMVIPAVLVALGMRASLPEQPAPLLDAPQGWSQSDNLC